MSNPAKVIRGQVRQAVKEVLPEVLTHELRSAMYKQIAQELGAKLISIQTELTNTLKQMDDRSKDVQNMLVREANNLAAAAKAESEKTE